MQHYPGQGFQQRPGQGMQHYIPRSGIPGQGFQQRPGQGMQHYIPRSGIPGQGFQQRPGQGMQHYPGQGFRQRPGQGMQHYPGQGFQQRPGQATQVRVPGILANPYWLTGSGRPANGTTALLQPAMLGLGQPRLRHPAWPRTGVRRQLHPISAIPFPPPPPPAWGSNLQCAFVTCTLFSHSPGCHSWLDCYLLSAHLLTCWCDAAHSVRGKPASANCDTARKCGRSTHTGGSAARQCRPGHGPVLSAAPAVSQGGGQDQIRPVRRHERPPSRQTCRCAHSWRHSQGLMECIPASQSRGCGKFSPLCPAS